MSDSKTASPSKPTTSVRSAAPAFNIRSCMLGTSWLLMLSYLIMAFVVLVPGDDWRRNKAGNTLGHDFSQVWVAGKSVLEGHAAKVYDNDFHIDRQLKTFEPAHGTYAWFYPPSFLVIAAGFALLPYPIAVLAWCLSTAGLLMLALWRIAPRWETLVIAGGTPIIFQNIAYGQNGALTAALLTFALTSRPIPAGLSLSLLAYKPHMALALPAALAAGGWWKTMLFTVIGVGAQLALTICWFGIEAWTAFFKSLSQSASILLVDTPFGYNYTVSGFGAMRLIGLPHVAAVAFQTVMTVSVVAALVWLWRSKADHALKAAALLCAVPLSTPHALTYDLTVLVPAIAFVTVHGLRKGFKSWEPSMLVAIWVMTSVSRQIADYTSIPLGFLGTATFFSVILWRAWHDTKAPVSVVETMTMAEPKS